MKGGGAGGAAPCLLCFAGGTEVALADDSGKPIEAIQLKDVVLSADQVAALDARAETKPQNTTGQVSELFSRVAPAVLDIAIGSDKITVTPEHEFWVIGEGWKQAKELWVGAKLLTKDSQEVRVEWIGKRVGEFRVYNFSVAGSATYFVGKLGVLVHNCQTTTVQSTGRAPKKSTPDTIHEQVDAQGNVRSRTYYDENGHPFSRQDFDHSHGGLQPHEHQMQFDANGRSIAKKTFGPVPPGY